MSGSRLVASLLLVALIYLLGANTAWAQQSQLQEVPGARVTIRVDTGWSHDLTLYKQYTKDENNDLQFQGFVLQGWSTTPALDSFRTILTLPQQYLVDRHGDWHTDAQTLTATDLASGNTIRIHTFQNDIAKLMINQQRTVLVSTSESYRAAIASLDGFELPPGESATPWYLLASIFEGASATDSSIQVCYSLAADACSEVCPNNGARRLCIKEFRYNPATNECSFACKPLNECCSTTMQ
jgi:hypothetical protein